MAKDDPRGRGDAATLPTGVALPRRRPAPGLPLARGSRSGDEASVDLRPNRVFRRLARALALESEEGLRALEHLVTQASATPATLTRADVILLELGLRRLLDRGLSSLDGEHAHSGLDALLADLTPGR
jgi:hypothetical protein